MDGFMDGFIGCIGTFDGGGGGGSSDCLFGECIADDADLEGLFAKENIFSPLFCFVLSAASFVFFSCNLECST